MLQGRLQLHCGCGHPTALTAPPLQGPPTTSQPDQSAAQLAAWPAGPPANNTISFSQASFNHQRCCSRKYSSLVDLASQGQQHNRLCVGGELRVPPAACTVDSRPTQSCASAAGSQHFRTHPRTRTAWSASQSSASSDSSGGSRPASSGAVSDARSSAGSCSGRSISRYWACRSGWPASVRHVRSKSRPAANQIVVCSTMGEGCALARVPRRSHPYEEVSCIAVNL